MKLSPRGKFQEVWTVQFDQPLGKRYPIRYLLMFYFLKSYRSGRFWIVETVSGDLYGHIVAGTPGGREAYILPAYKIFENIRQVMGPVEFVESN